MSEFCAKCGTDYTLRDGCDPTKFCDPCAQDIVEKLLAITPEPPNAITWECGVEILNAVQGALYPPNQLELEKK